MKSYDMKTAIFSDIHGNLPAFETMLKHAGKVDRYICLGDVVNYGPWSNECVQLLMGLKNCTRIMGNHDQDFINNVYGGTNIIVKALFAICIEKFTENAALRTFQRETSIGDFHCSHTIGEAYIYPDTNIMLSNNCIIGHSHHQFIYNSGDYILYNAGSVGQNRKFINVIDYITYDDELNKCEMKNLLYDVDKVINEMRTRKYPHQCIDYYLSKSRIDICP